MGGKGMSKSLRERDEEEGEGKAHGIAAGGR